MKLLAIVLISQIALLSQIGPVTPGPITATTTAPSGACTVNQGRLVGPGGLIYTCQNGVWAQVTSGGGPPTGPAGGALAGTYPNPTLAFITQAESFGASPSASAAANVTAINAALAVGGTVTLNKCGTYQINTSLIIGSNTWFHVAPCVTIYLANGSNTNLLVTNGYYTRATSATVTLGSPTGLSVPVTWTAHGLSVGDYVWIQGASPSNYDIVAQVATVPDANDFTYNLDRLTTTSPTGTATAKKANVNITIDGGIWDGNTANNPTTGLTALAVVLGVAENVVARNMTIQNSTKFCLHFGAVRDYAAYNITAPTTNSDIVKVYGPATNGILQNISGNSGDDFISFQTKEAAAFSGYIWTFGDIMNGTADHISGVAGGAGNLTALYPSANEYMGGMVIRNVSGSTSSVVCMVEGGYASSVLQDVLYENITAAGVALFEAFGYSPASGTVTAQNVALRHVTISPPTLSTQPLIFTAASVSTVNNLIVDDLAINNSSWPNALGYVMALNGAQGNVTLRNWNLALSSTNTRTVSMTSTASVSGKVVVEGLYQPNAAGNNIVISASVTTPGDWLIENSLIGTVSIFNTSSSVNLEIKNSKFTGATQGVIRNAGNVTINGTLSGNSYTGGSLRQVTVSGTPTLNLKDSDPALGTLDFGTVPAITGCGTIGMQTGGTTAGTFVAGAVSCAAVIALPTAPHGWSCKLNDLTTPADTFTQTASGTTSCTMSGTVVSSDVIQFVATPY